MLERLKHLPRGVAIAIWAVGFLLLFLGEMLALVSMAPGDTITEVVTDWMGVGEPTTPVNLVIRMGVIGFLGWLLFHFTTREV